ncbi:MAG: adenosylcobinamide-phosphate synthase CbiB [Thermodesulfovibrionales bacterium]|nr:adenosylcobinamide-phosphate synthase CbiB [Thermodesulfovibrionales bacterium]
MTDFLQYAPIILHSSELSISPALLMLAFLLDLVIGDPRRLPHPVRIMGSAISRTEIYLRKWKVGSKKWEVLEKFKGIFLVTTIVGMTFIVTWFVVHILLRMSLTSHFMLLTSYLLLIYLTSTTIAVRELINSARAVIEAVTNSNIESARERLSMIVGRDTHALTEKEILKATMESLAENLSDGVIAPVFYLVVGGLPLAMAYKAINTLDSMVGYKNDKYIHFGWAAARLDDIANYIPARITGWLIVASAFLVTLFKNTRHSLLVNRHSLRTMLRDGRKHLSPNSGMPEAAMAGALGIRMGGPSAYGGIVIEKPYIGNVRTEDYSRASEQAITIVKASSVLGIATAIAVLFLKGGA